MEHELESFLKDELKIFGDDVKVARPFEPITEGLGLHSPVKLKSTRQELPRVEVKSERPALPSIDVNQEIKKEIRLAPVPPHLPSVGASRRLASFVLDEIFTLTMAAMLWVLTSNLITGFETGFSSKVLSHMMTPEMLRIVAIEYLAVWSFYLAVSIFLSGQTMGMWAWGIRVRYGVGNELYLARKLTRWALLTLIFSSGILSVLLVVRLRGKNLVDSLSKSKLVS